jgi:phage I-like protein
VHGRDLGGVVSAPHGFEIVACATALPAGADGGLPTEFRIFRAGMNETTKGQFLFDEEAARITLAQFEREGVDMIADLEHLSLDPTSPNYDPDARAHFRLEVRGGELWACGVAWSPDGARRLTEKTQRYVSPVAMRDKETKRVLGVFNVGLVAQPATFQAQPLVAASKTPRVADQTLACKTLIALLCKHLGKN